MNVWPKHADLILVAEYINSTLALFSNLNLKHHLMEVMIRDYRFKRKIIILWHDDVIEISRLALVRDVLVAGKNNNNGRPW